MSEERLVAEIPQELKDLVDADSRNNKEIVISALWGEFGGERVGALERRIEEKKNRISIIESERNERGRELDELKEQLEKLKRSKDQLEETTPDIEEVAGELEGVPLEVGNPAIKNWAGKLNMTQKDLIAELERVQ